ncbi:jumonji superfamily protein [Coprinopsis sp. MPI-PUGE-AT-0042]|nr:jumonji superfamily protein [Coprinopsis sp. MPI-PUGE-AT-0042]
MSFSSRSSSLTPCQSPSPEFPIVQPDHFYGSEGVQLPPSPRSDGKTWLDPNDDASASRGIPVFKPTMEEFADFEAYMEKVNCWGMRSGIVKVIPPKEWTKSLPDIKPQLRDVKIRSPIEQVMLGSGGLFRQQNMEKRKVMSVREWAEWCGKDEYKAPAKQDIGLDGRGARMSTRTPRRGRKKGEPSSSHDVAINGKDDEGTEDVGPSAVPSPPPSEGFGSPKPPSLRRRDEAKTKPEPKAKGKRPPQTREERQASLADRAVKDNEFVDSFQPHLDWLPPNTTGEDYNPEYCQKLERHFWRNCGLGKSPWYGADTQGTLFTDDDKVWNVGRLPSALSRLLPSSDKGLPGVNTPYLYFGMWRATFAWHVEDMDLYSINYIHFGAPKFWYAIPQAKADSFETVMRGLFPEAKKCPQFLRHKSYLASPMTLAKSNCRPNFLVQQEGEFVITYPRGYHAGFNLGFNCAESVNFALECWIEMGRVAKACKCVSDSVRIDVDQLLHDRAEEAMQVYKSESSLAPKTQRTKKKDPQAPVKQETREDVIPLLKIPLKRKVEDTVDQPKAKKIKLKPSLPKASGSSKTVAARPTAPASNPPPAKISVKLKLGPKPAEQEPFPCCLCVSMDKTNLLRVQDPPVNRRDAFEATGNPKVWMAHEQCASIIPETWVDEHNLPDGSKARVVHGVDAIVKDRWNLKCSACSKSRPKAHGAPVQCTKGKCPKAFHVSCARDGHDQGIVFSIVREVEKEVVLMQLQTPPIVPDPMEMQVDPAGQFFMPVPSRPKPEAQVLKRIKKLEYQILCPQHNPALAAQKKASKQEKIKTDLLALPIMSRIKIRVSSGVFEVSLLRVIEETGSVEVLWDRGLHREFKWGCVVFGSTDGPVQQRPTEAQTPVEYGQTYASTSGASRDTTATPTVPASTSSTPTITIPAAQPSTSSLYPYGTVVNAAWTYTPQRAPYGYAQGGYGWTYPAYYQTPYTAPAQSQPQAYQSAGGLYTNREGRLQWQRPYEGPSNPHVTFNSIPPSSSSPHVVPASATVNCGLNEASGITAYSQGQANASPPLRATPASPQSHTLSSDQQQEASFRPRDRGVDIAQKRNSTANATTVTAPGPDVDPLTSLRPIAMSAPLSQFPDLSALMKLSQAELSELLNKNPQLSHYIMASVQQSHPSSSEATG